MKVILTGIYLVLSVSLFSQEQDKLFQFINNSDRIVEKIFDNREPKLIRFHSALFKDWDVYSQNQVLFMDLPVRPNLINRIQIKIDTVKSVLHPRSNVNKPESIKTFSFRTNMR